MFDATVNQSGEVLLSGRFDAAQVDKAKAIFDNIESSCIVNFEDLEYISSAGLSVLLATQKRLNESGESLTSQPEKRECSSKMCAWAIWLLIKRTNRFGAFAIIMVFRL